ncbi:hypothetical protein ADUPG1_004892, partial [Aduncisulcus paluster]
MSLPSVCKISCGRAHVACVTLNGSLIGWGSDESGQLGRGGGHTEDGTTPGPISASSSSSLGSNPKYSPVPLIVQGSLLRVCVGDVVCGSESTAVVTRSGRILMSGCLFHPVIAPKGRYSPSEGMKWNLDAKDSGPTTLQNTHSNPSLMHEGEKESDESEG